MNGEDGEARSERGRKKGKRVSGSHCHAAVT